MSGFLRTVTDLGQNFFACLAGREAFAVLEKPWGFPSRRVGEDSPGVWLPAGTKGRAQSLSPGGGEGHRERHFAQQNCLFSLQHSLWQSCPAGLVAGSQTARQKGGGCISCVMTDCLWLKDYPNRSLLAIYCSAFPVSKLNN